MPEWGKARVVEVPRPPETYNLENRDVPTLKGQKNYIYLSILHQVGIEPA